MATSPIYHYILLYQVYINRCFLFYEEHIVNLCPYLIMFSFIKFDLNYGFLQSNTYFADISQYYMLPFLYFIGVLVFDCATIYYMMLRFQE